MRSFILNPVSPLFDKRWSGVDNKKQQETHEGEAVERQDVLDSWKEISSYLGRDVKTCQRWEKHLGLPVHRYDEDSTHSKVFAYKSEIDRWMESRKRDKPGVFRVVTGARWKSIASVVLGIGALILIAGLWSSKRWPFSASAVPSVAVVPFENVSSSSIEDYLSEGLTRELVDGLTRVTGLKVITAGEAPQNLRSILTEEGIGSSDYTLAGRLEREGTTFRIRVELLRDRDHQTVWSNVYEASPGDFASVQDQIFQDILEGLNAETGRRLENRFSAGRTRNNRAFDSYMKGRYLLNHSNAQEGDAWKLYHEGKFYSGKWTREHNELAINLFHRAIQLDSRFSLAYLGLAQCYSNNINFNWDHKKEWLDKAEELAAQAQELSPDLPEYFVTLTEIYILKDLDFGDTTIQRAFELAMEGAARYLHHSRINSIAGYCYFARYGREGRERDFQKALEYKEKSFYLDPRGLHNIVFAELLMLNKEFRRAEGVCQILEPLDSSTFVKFRKGEIYYYMGDLERSQSIFQSIEMPLDLKIHSLLYLGMIAAQQGKKDEALRIVREIGVLKPQEYRDLFDVLRLGSIYMGCGEKEKGYACLESVFNNPFAQKDRFIRRKYVEIDRNFASCIKDARFQKILEGDSE